MKKLLTVVFTLLLAGSLAFAQTGGDKNQKGTIGSPTGGPPDKQTKVKKEHKGGKKGHKKSKKGSTTTTPPPK